MNKVMKMMDKYDELRGRYLRAVSEWDEGKKQELKGYEWEGMRNKFLIWRALNVHRMDEKAF